MLLNPPQDQRNTRESQQEHQHQDIGLEHQAQETRNHENQVGIHPHKLQPAHRDPFLPEQFEEIVEGLQNGRTEAALQPGCDPPVDAEQQSTDNGCDNQRKNYDNQLFHFRITPAYNHDHHK